MGPIVDDVLTPLAARSPTCPSTSSGPIAEIVEPISELMVGPSSTLVGATSELVANVPHLSRTLATVDAILGQQPVDVLVPMFGAVADLVGATVEVSSAAQSAVSQVLPTDAALPTASTPTITTPAVSVPVINVPGVAVPS